MLKVTEILKDPITVKARKVQEIRTYSIRTERMNDDCLPIRYAQSLMIWIDKDGYVGEMESIFPIQTDENIEFAFSLNMVKEQGFPQVEIKEKNMDIKVKDTERGFILLFSDDRRINRIIECGDVKFYCLDQFVIALEAMISM